MAVVSKRHFWGHKKYDTKTGMYEGEKRTSSSGDTCDWRGRTIKRAEPNQQNRGMGAKVYDD